MSLHLELTAKFHQDFAEARLWYDQQRTGLGDDLAQDFYAALFKIQDAPTAHSRFGASYRKRKLGTFRHTVYYRIDGDTLYVVALIHNRRSPEFVRDRLRQA